MKNIHPIPAQRKEPQNVSSNGRTTQPTTIENEKNDI